MEYPYASELLNAYYGAKGTINDGFTAIARHVLENAALWSERLGIPLPAPATEPDTARTFDPDDLYTADNSIPGCDCGCAADDPDTSDYDGSLEPGLYDIHEVAALIGEAFAAFVQA